MAPTIHGVVSLRVKEADPKTGKPYLELDFPDGPTVYITTSIAEMIGGAGTGARLRHEDLAAQRSKASSKN